MAGKQIKKRSKAASTRAGRKSKTTKSRSATRTRTLTNKRALRTRSRRAITERSKTISSSKSATSAPSAKSSAAKSSATAKSSAKVKAASLSSEARPARSVKTAAGKGARTTANAASARAKASARSPTASSSRASALKAERGRAAAKASSATKGEDRILVGSGTSQRHAPANATAGKKSGKSDVASRSTQSKAPVVHAVASPARAAAAPVAMSTGKSKASRSTVVLSAPISAIAGANVVGTTEIPAVPTRPETIAAKPPHAAPAVFLPPSADPSQSEQLPATPKRNAAAGPVAVSTSSRPTQLVHNAATPIEDKLAPTKAQAKVAPIAPAGKAKAPEPKPAAKALGPHRTGFKTSEFIVYPAHGVGQIVMIEEQEVAGFKLELFVISFVKDKMTLKVPLPKVLSGAIRKLSEPEIVKKALDTLTGRARIKRTMWSRRAQEYEAKINSGDLVSIAEVVRDLYRSEAQPEQSYSERQLYEAALDRMARELVAVQKLTDTEAFKLIEGQLQKGPRRGSKAEAASEGEVADADIDEAA